MSADDRTETQWGVRYPDGTVGYIYSDRTGAANQMREIDQRLADARSTERAAVVTRTRTITYTEWTEDE